MQAAINPASALKALAFCAALIPLARLAAGAAWYPQWLGANPAEYITRSTGDWTLRFLLLTLAVTPLRTLTGWHMLARFRRMLGLFVFFYGVLHLLAYAWFDMGLDVGEIVHDIAKRPFILVGTLALLLLAVLAATSPHRAIRWLGAARWRALHRSVYVVAVLGILHFFWMRAGKNDFAEVLWYGALLAGLLGWRIRHGWRQRHKKYHPMP